MANANELAAKARQRQAEGAAAEAVVLWKKCLKQVPGDANEPWWTAALAQALQDSGEADEAARLLVGLQQRFPQRPEGFSGLALHEQKAGAVEAALGAWRDVLARFPEDPGRRWWLPCLAYTLLEAGLLDEAEEACRTAEEEFPEDAVPLMAHAAVAERRLHLEDALEHAAEALLCASPEERTNAAAMKLRILLEAGEVSAAAALVSEELEASGPTLPLLLGRAELAAAQGPFSDAREHWRDCLRNFPREPDAIRGQARFWCSNGEAPAAEALLREAVEHMPRHAGLWQSLAETLALRRDREGARAAWNRALELAPGSSTLLIAHCAFLGALGTREEAEDLLVRRAPGGLCLWQCRYAFAKAARELDEALSCLAEIRRRVPGDGHVALDEAEIRSWRQERGDLESAEAILKALHAASPSAGRALELLIRVMVLLGEHREAAALIAALPPQDNRRGFSDARLWLAIKEEGAAAAKPLWDKHGRSFFLPALHLPAGHLRLLHRAHRGDRKGAVMVSVLRNEYPRLAGFLAHHRALGVAHFVLLDNGSDDGTRDCLMAEPDVTLYATSDSFAASSYGMRWLNQLIDRHAADGWVAYADADERLVYPHHEHRPLPSLLSYLTAGGYGAVAGVMIDLFPHSAAGILGLEDMWFDPPHLRPSLASPYVEAAGGVRRRLFGTTVALSKAPLINAAAGVRYLGSHTTTPAAVAPVTVALLHRHLDYLFDAANAARMREEASRAEHSDHAVDRRRMLARHGTMAGADLTGPGSHRYAGSEQLRRLGLVRTCREYEEWTG